MDQTVIKLKWIDDDLRQIKIIVDDGQEPSYIVYPRSKECDRDKYCATLVKMFERICKLFEERFGILNIYGPYGVFTDDSAVLAHLINWHDISNFVSVDPIPVVARQRLEDKIKALALGWNLANKEYNADVERRAIIFAKSEVGNFRWLFDYEISIDEKCLLQINTDALELEWYALNHDDFARQRKFEDLANENGGIGLYEASRLRTSINSYSKIFGDKLFVSAESNGSEGGANE